MSLIEYPFLPTTTLTSVTLFEGQIDVDLLYFLLPITYLNLDKLHYKKIPTCVIKGAILSVRYKGCNRGFVKDTCFKNSLMIDLSMGNKNVSIKLSQKKIQLCGASSEQMSKEAGDIILAYILKIQEFLQIFNRDDEQVRKTIDWVIENTREYSKEHNVFLSRQPENFSLYDYKFPEGVHEDLARWLIPYITDYVYHDDYIKFIQYIKTIKNVIVTDEVILKPVEIKMKNHNYLIPFVINRGKLFKLFKTLKDWIVIHDATWDKSVKLLRLSDEKKSKMKCEEEELLDKYHTFIIFSTGSVTQSGPNSEEIERFYNEFNRIIRENRDTIELKTNHFTMRKIRIPTLHNKIQRPAPPYHDIF